MSYYIPLGYSRVILGFSGPSSLGSRPSFGFGCNASPSPDLVDEVLEWWTEELAPLTHNSYTCQKVEARDNLVVFDQIAGVTGARSGDAAQPQTSALVSLTTGFIGRQNRGRMYWPGVLLDGDVYDDGSINPTQRAALTGALSALEDKLAAHTPAAQLYILHGTELVPTVVTGANVQSQTATVRRRNRR